MLPKKVCLVPYKCKGAKNSYEGYPTEFAGSTQNPKKITRTPNLPIKKKIFPKKVFKSLKEPKKELPDGICPESLKNNRTQV
jgi:hypothetical protein